MYKCVNFFAFFRVKDCKHSCIMKLLSNHLRKKKQKCARCLQNDRKQPHAAIDAFTEREPLTEGKKQQQLAC